MIHDSQPLKNWSGGAKPTTGKRKAVDISFPLSENMDHARQKKAKASSASHFLVDGFCPINPHPRIIANRHNTASMSEPARRKSMDIKSLIQQLIDEVYPPLICPECYHVSTARTEADQHLKSNHLGQKVFKCVSSICTQVYSSKAGLRYHIEHAHQISRINDESLFNLIAIAPPPIRKQIDSR
ncbi:hypothetical protein FB192DRAFT_1088813 [Mucor lusitanicus]|uniref:C2H2-type domain-containing protein n=1 Tax=Mucor circinelloides f. lusitanicus TaxID=29924 RepID=A0A8H4BL74_MUCCL|nr:hypothetical protein FB192DRAFT_1088813 [Mucor lusitanicus]